MCPNWFFDGTCLEPQTTLDDGNGYCPLHTLFALFSHTHTFSLVQIVLEKRMIVESFRVGWGRERTSERRRELGEECLAERGSGKVIQTLFHFNTLNLTSNSFIKSWVQVNGFFSLLFLALYSLSLIQRVSTLSQRVSFSFCSWQCRCLTQDKNLR